MKTKIKELLIRIEKYVKQLISGGSDSDSPSVFVKKKSWDECTRSSNWHGNNAAQRMMNILSPHMPDSTFKERVNFIKSRGCNCVNLFLTNKADGEYGGYSIYGSSFDWTIDKSFAQKMLDRVVSLYNDGFGIVLWLTADDGADWADKIVSNPLKFISDLDSLGFFKYASTVVVGLEADEYWKSASKITTMYKAVKAKYSGKVGVHQKSGEYGYMPLVDIAFVQLSPGASDSKIKTFVQTVRAKTGKPVCMFELERSEDRKRCEVAISAGAFSVGNW